MKLARWFDHKGGIIEAPWAETPRATAYGPYDRLTHWVFGEQSETAWHQAVREARPRDPGSPWMS